MRRRYRNLGVSQTRSGARIVAAAGPRPPGPLNGTPRSGGRSSPPSPGLGWAATGAAGSPTPRRWATSPTRAAARRRERSSPPIRAAAEDSVERYPDHPHALHYESVKRGVQKASEIRLRELEEDYPWVPRLMQPLRGMTVPCAFSDVEDAWHQAFGERFTPNVGDRLPPDNPDGSWRGLRESLERLGIMERMRDDRVDMPDLYRVGFGLGRRGGVRPVVGTPSR
jgi:hypothetical protein